MSRSNYQSNPPQEYDQYGGPKYFSYGRAGQKLNPVFGTELSKPHSIPKLHSSAYDLVQNVVAGATGLITSGVKLIPGVGQLLDYGLKKGGEALDKWDVDHNMTGKHGYYEQKKAMNMGEMIGDIAQQFIPGIPKTSMLSDLAQKATIATIDSIVDKPKQQQFQETEYPPGSGYQ